MREQAQLFYSISFLDLQRNITATASGVVVASRSLEETYNYQAIITGIRNSCVQKKAILANCRMDVLAFNVLASKQVQTDDELKTWIDVPLYYSEQ